MMSKLKNLFKISKKEVLNWILTIMCIALLKVGLHTIFTKQEEKARLEKIQARKDYLEGWKSFVEGVDTTDSELMEKFRCRYNNMVEAKKILGREKYQEQWSSFIEGTDTTDTELMEELRHRFNSIVILQSRIFNPRSRLVAR